MSLVRRVVSLVLLFAIGASSVEVVFGDAVSLDRVSAEALSADTGETAADEALAALPAESEGEEDDCACLCACVCAGAQLVVLAVPASFDVESAGVEMPVTDTARSFPFPAPRPHFRPPLA